MNSDKKLAVCLVSGGMDSCVCAALAREAGFEIAALHVSYGQRTHNREKRAFRDILAHYRVKHVMEVSAPHFGVIGGSALTDRTIGIEKSIPPEGVVPDTYVPFRNASILSIGVSWAEIIQAKAVYIGVTSGDGPNYPDCTEQFIDAFQAVVREGTKPGSGIRIMAPLVRLKKSDIVSEGKRLDAPFELTWSCYSDEDQACGECASCLMRLEGFRCAGIKDPIPYRGRFSAAFSSVS